MKKTIGILGGMGPAATADLFGKNVNFTRMLCTRRCGIRVFHRLRTQPKITII